MSLGRLGQRLQTRASAHRRRHHPPSAPKPAPAPPVAQAASVPPPAAPVSAAVNGGLALRLNLSGTLFNGSLACGCLSAAFYPYQSYISGHVGIVPDPLGSAQNVIKFAVADGDRPYSGASNPRADLETPPMFMPGDDKWFSVPVMIPVGTPAVTSWMGLAQVYGPPHGGSPPVSLGLSAVGTNGQNHFMMGQDANHAYRRIWTGPAADDGRWHIVTYHVNFQTDNTGSVQIYFDGQLQTFTDGTTTLHEATLDPGVNWDGVHANILDVQSYRAAGTIPGVLTTYAGAPLVGPTLSSVQP